MSFSGVRVLSVSPTPLARQRALQKRFSGIIRSHVSQSSRVQYTRVGTAKLLRPRAHHKVGVTHDVDTNACKGYPLKSQVTACEWSIALRRRQSNHKMTPAIALLLVITSVVALWLQLAGFVVVSRATRNYSPSQLIGDSKRARHTILPAWRPLLVGLCYALAAVAAAATATSVALSRATPSARGASGHLRTRQLC